MEPLDRHRHARPRSARLHQFSNGSEEFILDVEGGRVLHLPAEQAKAIGTALSLRDSARAELMALGFGVITITPNKVEPPKRVALKALSLAVAQKCNLGCTYCYAQQGTFGGTSGSMPPDVAKDSVDRILENTSPGEKVTLAFMGGEPLTNRKTLHATTHYAAEEAAARGVSIGFTMTTNATLIRPEDIDLFQEYGFTLTISVDGIQAMNDQLRPFVSGKGSFEHVEKKCALAAGRRRTFLSGAC